MFKSVAVLFLALLATSTCKRDRCLEGETHKPRPSPEPDMHECTLYSESSCCYANFTEQLAHSPVIKVSHSSWDRCGETHKPRPSPEPDMHECTLYSESSCCYANFTEQLAHSPVIKVSHSSWDRCGELSKSCEEYMKKIECFYRCSPHAAHWINPNYTSGIKLVPLCQNFCDDWYEACKSDLTCVHNWLTDWEWDENGENHCKNECISYDKVYANGTDLCQSMWGDSFKVSDSSCLCLQMNETDAVAIRYLTSESSEESSSVSSSEERACRRKLRKIELRKEEEGVEVFEIL